MPRRERRRWPGRYGRRERAVAGTSTRPGRSRHRLPPGCGAWAIPVRRRSRPSPGRWGVAKQEPAGSSRGPFLPWSRSHDCQGLSPPGTGPPPQSRTWAGKASGPPEPFLLRRHTRRRPRSGRTPARGNDREPRRGRSHPERVRGSASTPSRARVSGAASGVRAIGPLLPESDDADIAWSAHV